MQRHCKHFPVHYPTLNASLDIGQSLFEKNDSKTAFSHFVSLGLQGDPDSQFNVVYVTHQEMESRGISENLSNGTPSQHRKGMRMLNITWD